ncbi:dickkopf-related protein 1 [Microcaecilia unicolor]|uniref:Dickkopf-related protein 1 n=1 Tax=Microcaecilia unicolor TaxID=1415580 RepID=A0A6P7Y866_9AMPH|nr:dickkopf-related protein 1 [Microcaecilia unicolor]
MYLEVVHVFLAAVALCCSRNGASASVMPNSNAIKNLPAGGGAQQGTGYPVSASPDLLVQDTGNKNQAVESYQPYVCLEDDDCAADEFCYGSRGGMQICLSCRKRRKRCIRDAMCCPGNYCNNGICVPYDHDQHDHLHHGEVEEMLTDNFPHDPDHGTLDTHLKRTTTPSRIHHHKGQEGDVCLRSSDCSEGLCCARHFWSKICKPVLKEGQVCTKHKRKGSHGLEIFQRCDCGESLTCRTQRGDHTTSKSNRLHTCQRH